MHRMLDGVRVVEVGHIVLAPLAGRILGDWGAEVIKIEPPEGDWYRALGATGPRAAGMSAQWMAVNRNKRSVCLDLKTAEGRAALDLLLDRADVALHNLRPPAAARLGLSPDALRAARPGLIACAAVGFGENGPYADRAAFDDVIQGWSGLAELNGRADGAPRLAPFPLADMATANALAQAILAALYRKARTGEGCALEAPMFECAADMVLTQHLAGHAFRPDEGAMGYARVTSPHRRPARTADGWLVHGVYTLPAWRAFLAEVGRDDVAAGPWLADRDALARHLPDLYALAADIWPGRSTAAWLSTLERLGIPCAPAMRIEDLPDDPHLRAVGLIEEVEHPTRGPLRQVRQPVTVADAPRAPDGPPPELGADGPAVLAEAGMAEDRIAALIASGALRAP